jgi:hypothetical protein
MSHRMEHTIEQIRNSATVKVNTKHDMVETPNIYMKQGIKEHTLLQALRRLDLPTFGRPIIAIWTKLSMHSLNFIIFFQT